MLTPHRVKIITACAVAFALGSLVLATVRDVRGAEQTQAEKDGFTVAQVLDITTGLNQLASYDGVDKEGKPVKGYYKFSQDVRWLIALNIDLGRNAQTRLQTASNELIVQFSGGAGSVPEDKRGVFSIELGKLMAAQSRVGFYHIKKEDLKLDENPIPAPVLSLILPIIDR